MTDDDIRRELRNKPSLLSAYEQIFSEQWVMHSGAKPVEIKQGRVYVGGRYLIRIADHRAVVTEKLMETLASYKAQVIWRLTGYHPWHDLCTLYCSPDWNITQDGESFILHNLWGGDGSRWPATPQGPGILEALRDEIVQRWLDNVLSAEREKVCS